MPIDQKTLLSEASSQEASRSCIRPHFGHEVGVEEQAEVHAQLGGEVLDKHRVCGGVRCMVALDIVKVGMNAPMHAQGQFMLLSKTVYHLHACLPCPLPCMAHGSFERTLNLLPMDLSVATTP